MSAGAKKRFRRNNIEAARLRVRVEELHRLGLGRALIGRQLNISATTAGWYLDRRCKAGNL